MAYFKQEESYKYTDGDVTREGKRTILKRTVKEDLSYCFMIFRDLGRLYELQDNQIKVLIELTRHMSWDNIVKVTGSDRKEWAEVIGITPQTFNVALSRLMHVGLVIRKSQAEYVLDPEIFNMGKIADVFNKAEKFNAFFEIEYTMDEKGRKRKVKSLRVSASSPDNMKIDPETGEIKYTRRGRPCKKPTAEEFRDLHAKTVDAVEEDMS